MKLQARRLKETEISHLSLFTVTVFFVLLMVLFYGNELLSKTQVLDKNSLNLLRLQVGEEKKLFLYVLRERCWIIPVMFLLSTTHLTNIMGYAFALWYGSGIGAIIGMAMLRYGLRGMVLILAAGFPQFLLYIPAFVISLKLNKSQRISSNKFFLQLFLLETVVIIGCVLESYVNPVLLKKIIYIFVTK